MTNDRIVELEEDIERLMRTAETGADWAEICRIEAEIVSLQGGASS